MRYLTILMTLTFALFCSPVNAIAEKIHIVTTIADFKTITEKIGKNHVSVISLTRGNQDPHHVQIKPSDILKVRKADILIINGLGIDDWVNPLIMKSRNNHIRPGASGYINASIVVHVLDIPKGKVDRSSGHIHLSGNPHYNLSPIEMRKVVRLISKTLSSNYPSLANDFERNTKDYLNALDQKMITWQKSMKPFEKTRVVTFHNGWQYFFKDFDLESGGYMEPKPGVSPSPGHINMLIQQIKDDDIGFLFKEPYFPASIPNKLASQTNIEMIHVPSYVGGISSVGSYIELIDYLVARFELIEQKEN
ncbi:MAG: zinc/manganese transport system substrate-binding protein [Nitrospinales bacterium]|jgi:zinc/manganese transport system substrate-binding protein